MPLPLYAGERSFAFSPQSFLNPAEARYPFPVSAGLRVNLTVKKASLLIELDPQEERVELPLAPEELSLGGWTQSTDNAHIK